MGILVGSARIDERGKISGGKLGDNNGKEVSTQAFYVSSKGWYILRPKAKAIADKIAEGMLIACNNKNIGYDQSNRLGIIKYGVNSKVLTEADCSSTVRACCIYAGFDPGNFTTANECSVLVASKLFEPKKAFVSLQKTPVYNGDVLVTKSKGHTVVVVSGAPRPNTSIPNNVQMGLIFDSKFYANNYPDLKKAGITTASALLNHFINYGMKEARQGIATFDVRKYRFNYPDLQKAYGDDWRSYYMHYIGCGYAEGRKGI